MFWRCVTSKGVGALFPTSETTDTRKYIEILEKYLTIKISYYKNIYYKIVNIWLSVKRKTQSDTGEIKSKEDIIGRFRSVCNEIMQLEIEKLYASLPSHCNEIIFITGLMFEYQFLK